MTPASTTTSRQMLPVIPLAALFLAAFVLPLIALVAISLFRTPQFAELSLAQYLRFFSDPFSIKVLTDTLWLGRRSHWRH